MPSIPRPPEPDRDHVLTNADARMATGHSIEELRAQTAWVATPKPIPVELEPEYHAQPYTPPAPRTWATVADQLDTVMRERLHDLFGSTQ